MSEQAVEQICGETESVSPSTPDAGSAPVTAPAQETAEESAHPASTVESPALAPEQAVPVETSGMDATVADAPKADTPKADAAATSGKIMIMSSGDRNWDRDDDVGGEPAAGQDTGKSGKPRLAALAAVLALATVTGALGGALGTAGLERFVGNDATSAGNRTFEATVARIDADILNLKLSVEQFSGGGSSLVHQCLLPSRCLGCNCECQPSISGIEALDRSRIVDPLLPVVRDREMRDALARLRQIAEGAHENYSTAAQMNSRMWG